MDAPRSARERIFFLGAGRPMPAALRETLQSLGVPVADYPDPEALAGEACGARTGCVLFDVPAAPGVDRLEGLDRLQSLGVDLPVVVFASNPDAQTAIAAFRHGAYDFIAEPAAAAEVVEVVKRAVRQSRDAAQASGERHSGEALLARLTVREREVLALVIAGDSNKHVGRKLGISPRTAERHRQSIMKKLGAHRAVELANILNGILTPPDAAPKI